MARKNTSRLRKDDRGKRANRGELVQGSTCSSCKEPTVKSARFCHNCGAALGEAPKQSQSKKQMLMFLGIIIAVSVISTLSAMLILDSDASRTTNSKPAPGADVGAANRQAASLLDLSTMPPREAADRLFNRVMSASERGDKEETERFAPMTVQAYLRAGSLDADGHFHLGLIYLVLEDFQNANGQALKIKSLAPDHLLATFLEYQVATLTNNKPKQAQIAANFRTAFKKEIGILRPEYTAHRHSIERLRDELMPSGANIGSKMEKGSGN